MFLDVRHSIGKYNAGEIAMHKVAEADSGREVISRRSVIRPSIEALGAFVLIEAGLWHHGHLLEWSIAAAAWITITTIAAGNSPRELGLTARGFRESLWVAFAGAAIAALIVLGGAVAGTLHIESDLPNFALRSILYAAWAFGQQFILQSFFFVRLEQIFRSKWKAVLAGALLFFVAHLPNPMLLIAAGIAGAISPLLFNRYRNIYTLAIAHALVGLALAMSIPVSVHHQMKVGSGYSQRR
jgi:hypothetical protein